MWLHVALRGVHLRIPWLYVAWRRLASLHVGSPLGSQNSLAPLIFDDPYGKPARLRFGRRRTPAPTLARMPLGVNPLATAYRGLACLSIALRLCFGMPYVHLREEDGDAMANSGT